MLRRESAQWVVRKRAYGEGCRCMLQWEWRIRLEGNGRIEAVNPETPRRGKDIDGWVCDSLVRLRRHKGALRSKASDKGRLVFLRLFPFAKHMLGTVGILYYCF